MGLSEDIPRVKRDTVGLLSGSSYNTDPYKREGPTPLIPNRRLCHACLGSVLRTESQVGRSSKSEVGSGRCEEEKEDVVLSVYISGLKKQFLGLNLRTDRGSDPPLTERLRVKVVDILPVLL